MFSEEDISSKKQFSISRRGFFSLSAAMTVPFISKKGFSNTENNIGIETAGDIPILSSTDEVVTQTCSTFDCGGKCFIKAHVKEGLLTRINTHFDNELDPDMPIMKGCVRGRGYRRFIYHPDRLKYPMKRVGKRGEGKFERISWEEAVATITEKLQTITKKYGPDCRFVHNNTAVTGGTFSGDGFLRRLLNMTGGYLEYYHSVSMGNTGAATPYTYGTARSGSSLDTLSDTKLVILWGHNPTETIFGHSNHYFQKMKQNGTKFIVGNLEKLSRMIYNCNS